jgi:ketopantoate reductase PanE/ApbA-like protein
MTRPAVLIVGAGATGFPVGYHLGLAGADVTFLVRRGKAASVTAPRRLYCYDDATLKTFADYQVVDDVGDLERTDFDYVLITFDGHVSRTPAGVETLRAVGDVVRPTDAVVIMCGFGMGVREHHLEVLGIAGDRLLHGFVGMLAHQSDADLPVHPPTDPVELARSVIAYRHPGSRVGFRLDTGNPRAARSFAALYDRSGVSRCARMSKQLDAILCTVAFPVYAACELSGWADFATVSADKELWGLACRAQREIASLPSYGWRGKLVAAALGPRVTRRMHLKAERTNLPLDYQAFNRFHHGGKVRAQDHESLRDTLVEGRRQGHAMPALDALLQRLVSGPAPHVPG